MSKSASANWYKKTLYLLAAVAVIVSDSSSFSLVAKKTNQKKTSRERPRSLHPSELPVGKAGLLSCNPYIRESANRWPSLCRPSKPGHSLRSFKRFAEDSWSAHSGLDRQEAAVYPQRKSYGYSNSKPAERLEFEEQDHGAAEPCRRLGVAI